MIITVFFLAFKLFFTGFFRGDGDAQAFQCLKFRAFQGDAGDNEQIMAQVEEIAVLRTRLERYEDHFTKRIASKSRRHNES